MMTRLHRRNFLHMTLGGAAAAALLPRAAFAQGAALQMIPLADGLFLVTGAGANVVVGVEPDGLTLIDGGDAANAQALFDLVTRETGVASVKRLVNTHWHPQQTGANALLAAQGATIVAHENTRLWLASDIEAADGALIHAALPPAAQPTETFYDEKTLPFAGGELRAAYVLQAHTDGDLLVHFPEQNVIVAGGLLKTDGWAEIDSWTGGWMGSGPARALNNVVIPTYGGMIGGLQAIEALADDATVIVPADGPVTNKAEVTAQIQVYAGIADKLREGMFSGWGTEELLASAPAAGLRPEWGPSDEFVVQAFKSMWPHLTPDA